MPRLKSPEWLPLISSLLLGLAFVDYRLSPLVLVGLLPLIHYLVLRGRQPHLTIKIWAAGLPFLLLVFSWMPGLHPEVWTTVSGPLAKGFTIFAWLNTTLWLSLGFAGVGWALQRSGRTNLLRWQNAAFFAAAWVTAEYVRSWLFSIIYWQKDLATLGAHWNFGSLGYGAAGTPLGYLSRYLGVFGLSLAVVAINLAIYWIIRRQKQGALVLAALAILSVAAWAQFQPGTADFKVSYLHYKAGPDQYLAGLIDGSRRHGEEPPSDLLVVPEYSYFFSNTDAHDRQIILDNALKDGGLGISSGWEDKTLAPHERFNSVVFRDKQSRPVVSQPKTFLVPAGEYLPLVAQALLVISRNSDLVDSFRAARGVLPGTVEATPVDVRGTMVGALACSGMTTASYYRDLANQGAELLVNTSSLSIFIDAPVFYQQNKQMTRFQALANAKPFVQAVKDGPSYVLDGQGRFLVTDRVGDPTRLTTVSVAPSQAKTPYTLLGEWLVPLSLGAAVLGLLPVATRGRLYGYLRRST